MSFFSSFGQTFFISLFVPFFLKNFELTKGGFGTLYSLATLGSAFTLPYLGQWIDRIPLKNYSLWVASGLIVASLTVAVSWHFIVLFIGLYMLRLFGQGLTSHTSQTAMARYFDRYRGKALSISSLGFPTGEAVLPMLVTALFGVISWRMSWFAVAAFIALSLVPLIIGLLKSNYVPADVDESNDKVTTSTTAQKEENWSRSEVLRDPRLYFILPTLLLPPFLVTGFFLYQLPLAEFKGWTTHWLAMAFTAFAIARVIFSLVSGSLIDRFGASRLFPLYNIPLGIGLLALFLFSTKWIAFVYLLATGITLGMSSNVKSALYAELYGTRNLGTIKSMFSSAMVFSTATSPFLFGWLLDNGFSFNYILVGALFLIGTGSIMAFKIFPIFQLQKANA